MKKIWTDRRTFVGIVAIMSLTYLGATGGADVAGAIATVALAVAAANAAQGVFRHRTAVAAASATIAEKRRSE
jgi:hypothetical protein